MAAAGCVNPPRWNRSLILWYGRSFTICRHGGPAAATVGAVVAVILCVIVLLLFVLPGTKKW